MKTKSIGSKVALLTRIVYFLSLSVLTQVLVGNLSAHANIINAASPSFTDVSAAVAAASPGDTIIVPAGSAIWNSQLTIMKGIFLIGAGAGNTVITSGISIPNSYLIKYKPTDLAANNPFRISGFTFDIALKSHGIFLDGTSTASAVVQTKCRIDHNTFIGGAQFNYSYQAIHVSGPRGVVDNNYFNNIAYPIRNCWGPNPSNYWWNNWNAKMLGTADNMYYEDNIFTGVEIVAESQYGNRYVFRYNNITTYTASYPLMDIHGNHSNGDQYSSFGGEVYGNQINDTFGMRLMDHRGGKLLLFMNNSTTPSWHIQIRNEAPESSNPSTNSEPQYPNDTYYFLNRRNLTGSAPAVSADYQIIDEGTLQAVPKENREFWNGNASFDGTTGVGWGTLAARPTTCTKGVGYWATDQSVTNLTGMVGKNPSTPISGTLYRAVATNTWEEFYKPYPYPHPLRNEGTPAATIMASSPNGGESWVAGSSQNITWTTTGTVGNVKIEYSTNGGSSYSSITASTANTGSYNWTVPNTPSTNCLIRVSEASTGTPTDSSNAPFSISAVVIPAALTVTFPNGGESWVAGSAQTITWTTTGTVGNVKIEYSTNSGTTYSSIIASTTNNGSYAWTVPNTPSATCLVRVSQASTGTPVDASNAVFAISGLPTVTLTSPNGGESRVAGSSSNIFWSSTGTVGNVKIEYSTNSGTSYATLVASATNNGSYAWTVPNTSSTTCLVKVSQASTGTPVDISNATFTIASQPAITLISPNGGENWAAGTSQNISWSTTGAVGNVKIEYSFNGGSTYSSITTSEANDGSYAWTVPSTPASTCLLRISEALTGNPTDVSNAVFTIAAPSTTTITLSQNRLTFGASIGGSKTPVQPVLVSNTGQGTFTWTVEGSGSPYFLQVTPSSGIGNGIIQVGVNATGLLKGTYTGYVKVYASGSTNSPQTITVKLRVYDHATTTSPFGTVDTPLNESIVQSSVPVTGWVLDDIAVESVKIYREPLVGEQGGANGLAYIGDAIFVDGARNDIPDIYPDYPQNYKAGWGYMMLTNMLPPTRGNGVYRLHAIAVDAEGNELDLGTKTIHCDNAHAVKPFGAIDTPSQGGTASGANFQSFGWALTPTPNIIPLDASTITVWVDGESLGHPLYGYYRSDIASLFPGLANSSLSTGVFELDTTQYLNGVHTIAWGVTDSAGNADGIGSRFFNILNTGGTQGFDASMASDLSASQSFNTVMKQPVNSQRLSVRKGIGTGSNREILTPDNFGTIFVEIKETERVEVDLGNALGLKGGLVVGGEFKPLPIGSRLNSNKGTFSWMPVAGFLGEYDLMFLKEEAGGRTTRIPVKVSIKPKFDKN